MLGHRFLVHLLNLPVNAYACFTFSLSDMMSTDSQREETRSLDNLPENVLLHIFTFLNYEDLCLAVRMTCQKWRRLTFDSCLWKYVEIPMHFSDKRFMSLLRVTHKSVEELDLSKCENLTDYAISELASVDLARLKKLSMPISSTCSDCQYIQLMGVCGCLEDLSNVRSNLSDSCNPLYCQQVFSNMKICYDKPISTYGRIRNVVPAFDQRKLEQWREDLAKFSGVHSTNIETYECIRGTDFLNDVGLENVSKLFPNLIKIDLRQCNITDEGLRMFFDNNRAEGGLLEIQFDKPGEITDTGLKIIADHCPNLRKLKLARCAKVTNEGVNYILVRCPKLEDFHINNNVAVYDEPNPEKTDIDNSCLDTVAANCKSIRQFRIFYSKAVDWVGVEKLVSNCQYLTGIMLFECKNICDKALEAITQLKYLKSFVLVNSEQVTPKSIINLVLCCRYLVRMTLFCNNTLFYADQSKLASDTYEMIDATGYNYMPSMMRRLTIRGVGSGFTQLLTVLCPDLLSLDIREANFITNNALRSVLRNCEILRSLDVAAVDVDEELLLDLTRLAPELRHLTLGNALKECQGANEALVEVIKRCRSLSKVSLNNPNKHLKEELLVHVAKQYHGGHCVLHVDPDAVEDTRHRFIDLHFTPLKYLGSIKTVPFDEYFVDTPLVPDVEEKPEDVAESAGNVDSNAQESTDNKKVEASGMSGVPALGSENLKKWIDLSLANEISKCPDADKMKEAVVDLQALQAALDSLNVPGSHGSSETAPPRPEDSQVDQSNVQAELAKDISQAADVQITGELNIPHQPIEPQPGKQEGPDMNKNCNDVDLIDNAVQSQVSKTKVETMSEVPQKEEPQQDPPPSSTTKEDPAKVTSCPGLAGLISSPDQGFNADSTVPENAAVAEQGATARPGTQKTVTEEEQHGLAPTESIAEAATAGTDSPLGLSNEATPSENTKKVSQEEETQALAKLVNMLSMTLADERGHNQDCRHVPSIDLGFLQAALDSAKGLTGACSKASDAVHFNAKPDEVQQQLATEYAEQHPETSTSVDVTESAPGQETKAALPIKEGNPADAEISQTAQSSMDGVTSADTNGSIITDCNFSHMNNDMATDGVLNLQDVQVGDQAAASVQAGSADGANIVSSQCSSTDIPTGESTTAVNGMDNAMTSSEKEVNEIPAALTEENNLNQTSHVQGQANDDGSEVASVPEPLNTPETDARREEEVPNTALDAI